ncbi:hypothetical protein EXIGLDRAFT_783911 [Exidia glandulosa HHB12029]|uniref:Uncharacterized protein n=1 Tax=Exidia glandulosa HHB12029 TaxID=1314781 RepID=A0A166MTI5_EXIGL|nr:hypothetical protein EXIGLDRAFT_783911 [Exidia glandulosa HHB12029]
MIAASSSAKSIASLASVKSLRTFTLDTLRSDIFDANSVIRTGFAAVSPSSSATSIASSLDAFRLDMLSRAGCDASRTLEAGLAAHRRREKKRSTIAKTVPATGKAVALAHKADDPAVPRVLAMTSEEMIRSLRLKLHQMRSGLDADINAPN